jgi:hypothetical protein
MGLLQGRFVVPRPPGAVPYSGTDAPSGPLERIVKYVPTEIIAIYTAVIGLLVSAGSAPRAAVLGLAAVALAAIVVVIIRGTDDPNVRNAHLLVSPFAFVAWAYPISSALLGDWFIGWLSAVMQGAVLLLGYAIDPK